MSQKHPSDRSGMTVNERLYAGGLLPKWDAAANGGNRAQMIAVLSEVEIPADEAARIVDAVLADPQKFGFGHQHPKE